MVSIEAAPIEVRDETTAKRVLVLYSGRRTLPIIEHWEKGIHEGLAIEWPSQVAWESEYLDYYRVQSAADREKLLDFVEDKYRQVTLDLIVLVHDSVAHDFEAKGRFPGVPIVYCSLNDHLRATLPKSDRAAGVLYRLHAKCTMESIGTLLPDTQKVILVSGSHPVDRLLLSQVESELLEQLQSSAKAHPAIESWVGVPRLELLQRARDVRPGTVFLFISYMGESSAEIPTVPRDVARELSEQASVPVFVLYDTLMGTGVLGGHLVSAREQGLEAGRLAARILHGQTPQSLGFLPIQTPPLTIDWNAMQRWQIPENRLPASTRIVDRDPNLWVQYRYWLVSILLVVMLQSVTILGLLFARRRRARIEGELQLSRNEAVALAGKLITVQEDERKRIARDMHDDIAQRLAALAMETESLEKEVGATGEHRQALEKLHRELGQVSNDVRNISRELHPSILEDLGLAQAIEMEIDRQRLRRAVEVRFHRPAYCPRLPREIELCVYRVGQEALRNACLHSQCTSVEITLAVDAESVHLSVHDNGLGFRTEGNHRPRGIGLASMMERARLVHGTLHVNSEPGSGTHIELSVPLPL